MIKKRLGIKDFKIRKMTADDLDEVFKIENLSNPTPWSTASFLDCLKGNYLNLVVTKNNTTIAFCISSINFTESHLLNISINPVYRGLGIGKFLLKRIESECLGNGIKDIFLEVRESNKIAISFYKSMNYRYVGIRKNYYKAELGREDGFIYTKHMEISKFLSLSRQMIYIIKKLLKI
jgi:ribosomal-protein-alanine N-acetyltransferase|tara:strand:+ start:400 stop:933 length:534 start_codon:yes stop_codon:yes gene_type:complete